MKKLTKKQAAIRKKSFFEDYSADILAKYPTVKFYEHFIKIEVNGVELNYYPGAGSLMKQPPSTRRATGEDWIYTKDKPLSNEDFLKMIDIPIKKDFFTEEESLFLKDSGLMNDDLLD